MISVTLLVRVSGPNDLSAAYAQLLALSTKKERIAIYAV